MQFVDQLLLAGGEVDAPAASFELGDPETAIGRDVRVGEAETRKIVDLLFPWIGKAAPAHLRAALQQVPGGGARCDPRPVVVTPAEVMHRRSEEERRIGHPSRDHDPRAGFQRATDNICAEIRVAGYHPGQERLERLAGFHQRQLRVLLQDFRDVVPEYHGAPDIAERVFLHMAADLARSGDRVGRPHVAYDAYVVPNAGRQHRRHAVHEARRVALFGILEAGKVFARDGALRQALEREVVDLPPLGQLDGRRNPVVGKTGPGADTQCSLHESTFAPETRMIFPILSTSFLMKAANSSGEEPNIS